MKKSKLLKKVITVMVSIAIVALCPIYSAFASDSSNYTIIPITLKFSTYRYSLIYGYLQNGSINWTLNVASGVSAWNTSSAHVYVTRTTGSTDNILFQSTAYGNTGWDGSEDGPYILSLNLANIRLNDTYYYDDAAGHQAELVAHEMGHAFRLGDYDPAYKTLMRSSGYNGSPNPTASDIAGVNSTY